jgi:hypothetical protein
MGALRADLHENAYVALGENEAVARRRRKAVSHPDVDSQKQMLGAPAQLPPRLDHMYELATR